MLEHMDSLFLGYCAVGALIGVVMWRLAQNPTDKVERRGHAGLTLEAPPAKRRGLLARVRLRRSDRCSVRDAYTLPERPPDPPPMRRRTE